MANKEKQKSTAVPPEREVLLRRFTSRRNRRKPLWQLKVSDLAGLAEADDPEGYDPYNWPPRRDTER